jgi:uncharacterized membrane protein YdjX (TVP38/TMEM64 family)
MTVARPLREAVNVRPVGEPLDAARRVARWKIAAGGLVVLALLAGAQLVDLTEPLRRMQAWVSGLGAWAPVAFIAIYVGATLMAGPGLPFTLAAPLLFGPLPAFAIMVVASTLTAASAFLIARHLARDAVARRLAGNARFAHVNRLIDQHAWIIIPFVRIVPVPFALNNYGFGLTSISFWRYLFLSEVGMVPMNAVLVLGAGSAVGQVSGWPLVAMAGAALAIVVGLVIAGSRAWAGRASAWASRP